MIRFRAWRNVRARLLTTLLVTLAAALAATTYGFNVLFADTTSRSANSLLRARANSELSLLSFEHGRISLPEASSDTLGDSRIWVLGRTGFVARPGAHTALDSAARALATSRRSFLEVPSKDVRLYAAPVVVGGTREGTIVAGLSLAPYEQAERRALYGSLILAAIMLTVTAAAVWWLLKAALRPVVQMTEQAAAWSEFELDRRFERGAPYDELTLLAGTLDAMLDRIAASLRHERRFSAELSHELRTPLARVIAEVELALRRDRDGHEYRQTLELVLRNAHHLTRLVETLVTAAQHEALGYRGTADAYLVASKAVEEVSRYADERGLTITAETPSAPLRLGLDGDLAQRILHPIVENACRYGATRARVTLTRSGSKVAYLIEDDGPGIAAEEQERIFEPGTRGLAAASHEGVQGAGLGLALARRLARAASGDVTARGGMPGGSFLVTLPSA